MPVSFFDPTVETDTLLIVENTTEVGQVAGDDLDNQVLTYALTAEGADNGKFTITADGALSFNDAPDYESPGSATLTNDYSVEVSVTDGATTTLKTITVSVTDDPELPEPAIDQIVQSAEAAILSGTVDIDTRRLLQTNDDRDKSAPASNVANDPYDEFGLRLGYSGEGYVDFGSQPGDTATWTVNVDVAGVYDLHVRYATSDARPLDLVAGDTSATMDFPPISGTPFEVWDVRTIRVALTEGDNSISLAIPAGADRGPNVDAIAVTGTGAMADFFAPTFDADPVPVVIDENATGVVATVTATDPSDPADPVAYDLEGADSALFSINDAGEISFDAAPDFEAPADAGSDNTYDLIVAATAGGTTIRQPVTIAVENTDDEPVSGLTLTARSVEENEVGAVVADIAFTDPDTVYQTGDFTINGGEEGQFVVAGNATEGFTVNLAFDTFLDFEAASQPVLSVSLGGETSAGIALVVTDDDSDNVDPNAPPTAGAGTAATDFGQAVVIDLTDLIDDAEDAAEPEITAATSTDGTVDIDNVAHTLTFTPAPGFSGAATISYTVADTEGLTATADVTVTVAAEVVPTITLMSKAFDENVQGAVVADIAVTDANPTAGDFTVDNTNFTVIGEPGALQLALIDTASLNFEPGVFPLVTVSLGAVSATPFSAEPDDADDVADIILTPLDFDENVKGADVASIAVTDEDDDVYAAGNFQVDDTRFEVVDDGGLKLRLRATESLDAEAEFPTVTVSVGGGSSQIVVEAGDIVEPRVLSFVPADLIGYSNQDRPDQGGSVSISSDGGSVTLDGNLWKRATIDPLTITDETVLRVTIRVGTVGEAVVIGFDANEDAFDLDRNLYQLAGTQNLNRMVDMRNAGTANGDGTVSFEIPLGAQSGQTFTSIILANDDDFFGNGRGSVTFSGIEIAEPAVETGNAAPRIVGGGVSDVAVDERTSVEIDLPFVDDDGDTISYTYSATLNGVAATLPLDVVDGTLTGNLGDTAPGLYTIVVTADDDEGGLTDETFLLDVRNVNDAPVADTNAAFEPFYGTVGAQIGFIDLSQFAGAFSDVDGDRLEYIVTGLPDGLRIVDDVITGTPTSAGTGSFTVAVTDGQATSAAITIELQIDAPAPGDTVVVEAEDFTGLGASAFFATGQANASGDQLIRTGVGQAATVTSRLADNGVTEGWYTVTMDVYDELDGDASYSLDIGGVLLSEPGATYSDDGAFTNPTSPRGGAGQVGNRKTLTYTQEVYVDADTVLTLSGQADGELLRTDRLVFTRVERPNVLPENIVLTGDAVAENADGAVAGVLTSVDPDGDDTAITFTVDAGSIFEVDGTTLKLKDGEILDFEAGGTVSVDVTATDALGGSTTTTLTVAVADVDEAPGAAVLTPASVDENTAGAVIGQLSAVDPEGAAITFTVTDTRFEVDGTGNLKLVDGTALNFEEGQTVSVDVTADDGQNQTAGTVDVTVLDLNDAPAFADSDAIAPVTADFGAGATVDLAPLGATDEDGDALTYGVRATGTDQLPAGFTIDGTKLLVAGSVPAGTYTVDVFVNDGTVDSEFVSLSVSIGQPAPFEPFAIEAEDPVLASVVILDNDANTNDTTIRDSGNPETNPLLQPSGLRPDFSGTGYLDFGDFPGDRVDFTVGVPTAGDYDLNIRYASQGADRPLDLAVNAGAALAVAFATTDPDGTGPEEGFDNWAFLTRTISLTAGINTVSLAIPAGANTGPNIDRIEITAAGSGPIPPADLSADEDGNLAATAAASVAQGDLDAVDFTLSGVDADIVLYEVSTDGGSVYTPVTPVAGVVTLNLSAFSQAESVSVALRVTDAAGNFETRIVVVDVADAVTPPFTFTLELESRDGSVVIDDDTGNGEGDQDSTQFRDSGNAETIAEGRDDGLWNGYSGDGYLDMGRNVGDAFSFDLDAPVTGTYQVTFRYGMASGTDDTRPMTLEVNGGQATAIPFANTGDWFNWTDVTVDVVLTAGSNTIRLENTIANGPNLDRVTVSRDGTVVVPDSEPGPRETIAINFQDGTVAKADGYLVANFDGYQTRANGETYGFVTEASVLDADTANSTPIDGSAYPLVAINERSGTGENGGLNDGINFDAMDPRLTGYAHFDLRDSFPAGEANRVAFEVAVDNGWYEVTVAVGDTGGPNDSDNQLLIEGQLVSSYVPTDQYKTQLVTAQVEVTDGRLTLAAPDGEVTEMQYLEIRELPDLTPTDGNPAIDDYSTVLSPVAASGVGQTFVEQPLTQANGPVLGIDPTAAFTMSLDLAGGRSGVLLDSLNDGSIKVVETLTGNEVAISVNTSGGFDTLTISPLETLKEFTSYTLVIDGLLDRGAVADQDAPSREFLKNTFTFTTKEAPEIVDREVAFEDTVEYISNPNIGEVYTSIEISPDGGHLYTTSIAGALTRWEIDPSDGSIDQATKEVYFPDELSDTGGRRGVIGIVFDPEDDDVIWISDNYAVPLNGRDDGVPEFSGAVSRVTLGPDGSFAGATFETYITGLPRSNGDHVTNSLEFRNLGTDAAPDYKLYLVHGSNSAMGEQDSSWGFRPERLLNASVMEIDHKRTDVPDGGFDVSTEPVPQDGTNRRYEYSDTNKDETRIVSTDDGNLKNGGLFIDDGEFNGNYLHFDARGVATVRVGEDASSAIVDGGEFYNPYADDAVLKIFATGMRNPYDLVWHSNGQLYTPTNGSAAGGNVPDDPDTLDVNEAAFGVERQDDYLFIIPGEGGTYSGHPNALRNEFILNGGNPTGGRDPNQVNKYPVGIEPDANYDPDRSYSLGPNRSPNGAIEYTGDAFGANLKGAIVFVEYSNDNNLRAILLDDNGLPIAERDFALQRPDGMDIQSSDPLDVIQDAQGRLYVLTLQRGSTGTQGTDNFEPAGTSKIIRLDPAPGGVVSGDTTADAGAPLTLTVIDGTDAGSVIFAVTGLDDDIETTEVSFNGAAPVTVSLNDQGQFTANLSTLSGEITAVLTVQDEVPNTASTSISFTPGDPSAGVLIDALNFTVLSTLTGTAATVVRRLDDPGTFEGGGVGVSGNDNAPADGLNDGHDGTSYLDPNGGAEDKASFVVNANGAGTYSLVFRMASNSSRDITIQTNGQSETITVNTTSFTTWQDFPIELTLEDGPNTVIINQPGTTGPNIDSVRVIPVNVVTDTDADVGDNLAIALTDDSDRANTVFTVTGQDDDIETFSVSLNGGTAQTVTPDGAGQFTLNTTALSGAITVALTVTDDAAIPNTATASTDVTLAIVVSNDGTAVIDGVAYVLYEAENAALDGAEIIGDDAGEEQRGAEGGAFVDFNGTSDQTIVWTVEVAEDGTYGVDILYALGLSGGQPKAPRPMTLSVDGQPATVLPFVANSNADETQWGPQSTQLALTAGVHTLTITAPAASGPNVDQLRITQSPVTPVEPGNPNAEFEVESLDPTFFENRLQYSYLENPSVGGSARDFKDEGTVRLHNTGTEELEIRSHTLSGPFDLAVEDILDGATIAAGGFLDVEVVFDRSEYTPPTTNVNATRTIFNGVLTIVTNDEDSPVATVDLSGFWQAQNEGGQEPTIDEVWEVFGFGNTVNNAALDNNDIYEAINAQEILSPYWRLADGVDQAKITQIAAYHGPGGAGLGIHAPGDKGKDVNLGSHVGTGNQTILPLSNGGFQTDLFGGAIIPDEWDGDDIFGIKIANFSTDPTLNVLGPVQIDGVQQNHFFRFFQALDKDGTVIPNVYLGAHDYTGINYDYNDNMFVIEGVTPIGNGAVLAIDGLDDAAADDRLVFTNIEAPVGGQVFRNVATFTVDNDGLGDLDIQTLNLTGDFIVTGLAAGDSIVSGGSATVTVEFTGENDVNNTATLLEGALTIGTNVGTKAITLAGLAQLRSEAGAEPTVAQIVEAFGYGTDVAQGLLSNGGQVETVGDEVLLPYLERLDGSRPVEIIQIAAFLNQGNVARLSAHGLDSAELSELFAADDNQGQTILPDGLLAGPGDTGSVARNVIDSDEPFGLKVTVDGRPTFTSWTDPEANRLDPQLVNASGNPLVADDAGHLIRFFQARDGAGAVIDGTFIAIQDYPGAGNYDYNDHMFVIKNVQAHDLSAAEDANTNGINDALEIDRDGDGLAAFFDGDDTPVVPVGQAAFNPGATPWAVDGDGLSLRANLFDTGGQGVAYNDTTTANVGDSSIRPGEGVDISNGTGAIGYTAAGEWVEYTIDVSAAGTYALSFNSSTPTNGRALTATFAAAGGVYETVTVAVPNTGSYTTYQDTAPTTVTLQAGVQVLRVNFDLSQQDLQAFTLVPQATANRAPVGTDLADVALNEGAAFNLDAAAAFNDPDGDDLAFSATGLPSGLTISAAGVIGGSLPLVAADTDFTVTVTATDGALSASESFVLSVADVTAPNPQTPFPAGGAPSIGENAVFIDAGTFDNGGQGISWNDNPGRDNGGAQSQRANTDVELVGAEQDIGYIVAGEWVEYTVNVAEAGIYDLSVNAKTPIGGNTVAVSLEGGPAIATYALADSNGPGMTFGGTTFAQTAPQQVQLDAGLQTLRVTFDGTGASNGYLLDYRGLTIDRLAAQETDAIGESGKVTLSQSGPAQWTSVTFAQTLDSPSVVMGPMTNSDGDPAILRVRNVTDTGFEFQIDEWDYQNGIHGSETVSWLAIEAGEHEINGQTVVAGSTATSGSDKALSFASDAFSAKPVLLAQVTSTNDATSVNARLNSVSPTGFVVDLERQESATVEHGTETISWIAVEGGGNAGSGLVSGVLTNVTHLTSTASFGSSFASTDNFVFLADIQTENGRDPADVRLASLSGAGASVFVQEEQSKDVEIMHFAEDVGFVAIQLGILVDDDTLF